MRTIKLTLFTILLGICFSYAQTQTLGKIIIHPVSHASMVIEYEDKVIYVDPVGGSDLYKDFAPPTHVLITHTHGDHLHLETLKGIGLVDLDKIQLVQPHSVLEQTKMGSTIQNGETKIYGGIEIEAIPMYNLTEGRLDKHPKGLGNGYVLTLGDQRVYISGDTEDIQEMRSLKDIDIAFVCMNLPYTMSVEQAASAVLDFKPKVVFPYHYRGKPDFSDPNVFKELVSKDKNIEVRILDWYPN